jgi:hypothetical protein
MSDQAYFNKREILGVIAQNGLFRRSYLDTGLLQILSEKFSTEVLLSVADIETEKVLKKEGFLVSDISNTFTPNIIQKSKKITQLSWIAKRRKSPSFIFWHKRYVLGDALWFPKCGDFNFKTKNAALGVFRLTKKIIRDFKYFLEFAVPMKALRTSLQIDRLPQSSMLERELQKYKVVLLQGVGTEPEVLPILLACKKLQITTVLVIDNWDNLTSKNVLPVLPDYVTVLGEIDRIHAVNIHGFSYERIWAIGMPKLISLTSVHSIDSRPAKKNILYLGFSLPHAEKKYLNSLMTELSNLDVNFDFELSYRPHPAQKQRLYDEELSEKIVQIESKNLNGGLPSLDQSYCDSLLQYDLVIGTPTTLLLECMLLGIPSLCDLSDDGIHRTTASRSSQSYLHMVDLFSLEQVQVATSTKEMAMAIVQQVSSVREENVLQLENLVALPIQDFAVRLVHELEQILCPRF